MSWGQDPLWYLSCPWKNLVNSVNPMLNSELYFMQLKSVMHKKCPNLSYLKIKCFTSHQNIFSKLCHFIFCSFRECSVHILRTPCVAYAIARGRAAASTSIFWGKKQLFSHIGHQLPHTPCATSYITAAYVSANGVSLLPSVITCLSTLHSWGKLEQIR